MKPVNIVSFAAVASGAAIDHNRLERRQSATPKTSTGSMPDLISQATSWLMNNEAVKNYMKGIDVNKVMFQVLDKAQQYQLLDPIMSGLPQYKVVKTVNLPLDPQVKLAGAKTIEVWNGPIDLITAVEAAKQTGLDSLMKMDKGSVSITGVVDGFPKDITVLLAALSLRFEDGSPADVANNVYNHHTVLANVRKPLHLPFKCANNNNQPLSAPILTAVAEEGGSSPYAGQNGTFKSGNYLGKDQKILFSSEVVNYGNATKKIYAVAKLSYIEGKPKDYMESGVAVLNVKECDDGLTALRPPEGQKVYSYKSKEMLVTEDGYILQIRGHLHDGGESISMNLNGKEVCNSKAIYEKKNTAANGDVWLALNDMTECLDPLLVHKDDKVVIEAKYDLNKHPARKHAHASMMGGDAEEMGVLNWQFARLSTKQQ
ncbi:hypothetical protein BT63DRAFT_248060 [Microthyrium microscopicum]|uniref:Uncharacterized protein n=1 Tax=Microthyrium microscopicum TaxID=703497 RepID=A0A6A6UD22_9PEZI|nr:hypothetical protein BT63DRAFT_248060 [Microthyrium microscopicum]